MISSEPHDALFERLGRSAFRSRFRLGPKERDCLAEKGIEAVLAHACDFVAARLAPANPRNDGKQTPMRGHPVFIAQHATAACCRSCVAKWHGIEAGRALSPAEQAHLVSVIGRWLETQASTGEASGAESPQLTLFGAAETFPQGFRYQPGVISLEEEQALVEALSELPFKPFEFQNYVGKRRVASFGWKYLFDGTGLIKADDMPEFLLPLRVRAAAFAGMEAEALQHVLLTEYPPGAPIGWHKDRSVFGETIGISLLSPCRFRFRRQAGGKWERKALIAEPRSAYLLSGPSRTEWEHSIPEVEALRYSITFRNLREA